MFNGQKGRGRPSQSGLMKMSRQGGKVALKKKDVFLTSFPLEEFRFDLKPMDPSHPFELKSPIWRLVSSSFHVSHRIDSEIKA